MYSLCFPKPLPASPISYRLEFIVDPGGVVRLDSGKIDWRAEEDALSPTTKFSAALRELNRILQKFPPPGGAPESLNRSVSKKGQ